MTLNNFNHIQTYSELWFFELRDIGEWSSGLGVSAVLNALVHFIKGQHLVNANEPSL